MLRGKVFSASDLVRCYAPPNLLSVMPGNRVMLRSGGPEMVVSDVDPDGKAVCQWEEGGKLQSMPFALCCLASYGAK